MYDQRAARPFYRLEPEVAGRIGENSRGGLIRCWMPLASAATSLRYSKHLPRRSVGPDAPGAGGGDGSYQQILSPATLQAMLTTGR